MSETPAKNPLAPLLALLSPWYLLIVPVFFLGMMLGRSGRHQSAAAETRLILPYVPPKGYVCYRAQGKITIDGKLDDAAWQDAPWTDDFVDIEGDKMPKPRYRTRVKMLWDDDYFYVGAELEEPHVWATLTEHDSVIFNDNDFEVFIDPDGDNHEYYEFEINALGTTWDLLLPRPYRDGGRPVDGWDIRGLKSAVHVHGTLNNPGDKDEGWSVEIAFPWKALNELGNDKEKEKPPRNGDQWRVNFSRVEWQHEISDGKYGRKREKKPKSAKERYVREDNWVWSPQRKIAMHEPEMWGYVQFSTAEPGKGKYEPDPSGPVRYLLHQIYYAQIDHRKKSKNWSTLRELGMQNLTNPAMLGSPRLYTTPELFEATATLANGKRLHIRQDSKIWQDP